ncbi:unnamed protein product [Caenorhabditis auriculariae]|uniref:Sm domain-containing protein n=1 Tax=Caenorhabditis auriculariae TaxID=2777116 RepID=A0A8S1H896_9PELO|nr:unnamed protein product [Caenorhabditis auriculariae]
MEEFDAEKALEESASDGDDVSTEDLDEFELKLVENHPELALAVCLIDQELEQQEQQGPSKKQQKRERVERIVAMTEGGAELLTKKKGKRKEAWTVLFEALAAISEIGPLALLQKAIKSQRKVQIRVRSAVRIDRVFQGVPVLFDAHINVLLKDVVETVLLGRQEQRQVSQRRDLNSRLPPFLRWKDGGNWPLPRGAHHLVQHRRTPTAFIKGDSVVLISLI